MNIHFISLNVLKYWEDDKISYEYVKRMGYPLKITWHSDPLAPQQSHVRQTESFAEGESWEEVVVDHGVAGSIATS